VISGGAAAKVAAGRTVYTNISGNDLTVAGNRIRTSNAVSLRNYINRTLTINQTQKIIKWMIGYDVDNGPGLGVTKPRMELADGLHSSPVVVQYGGTKANPILTIFSSNNDGFLNAFNERTGETLYSFIPKELLPNIDELYANDAGTPKPYGLDGNITTFVTDANKNGIIDGTDKAIVYVGMRRGGRNYYALDVTSRTSPKLLWTIKGGQGDFVELGQTWSPPLVKKMKIGSKMKDVLIFGGGYDTTQDSNTKHTDDSQGRAIYIVDALTGAKIWWAGPKGSKANGANVAMPELTNGIVSEILALSLEGEGEGVTRLYVTDTRGQLFRFDINLKNTGARNLVKTSYLLAKLSEEGTTKGTRRLYYSADAALMKGYIALVMGTGYQAHPLETNEQNRIYMIKDTDVFESPKTIPATIVANCLENTTTLPSTVAKKEARASALSSSDGWYFDLDKGEKVLSKPLILDGTAIISSFTPKDIAIVSCKPGGGVGGLYRIDLVTSEAPTPESNLGGNGSKSSGDSSTLDRKVELEREGIPPTPVLITTKDGSAVLAGSTVSGIKVKTNGNTMELQKTYWYEDKTGKRPKEIITTWQCNYTACQKRQAVGRHSLPLNV